jgi:hypothetical protein
VPLHERRLPDPSVAHQNQLELWHLGRLNGGNNKSDGDDDPKESV